MRVFVDEKVSGKLRNKIRSNSISVPSSGSFIWKLTIYGWVVATETEFQMAIFYWRFSHLFFLQLLFNRRASSFSVIAN